LPEDDVATVEAMFKWLDKTISALDPLWRSKVVGVSTDGARAMTGWSAGLASRILEIALDLCLRVWCLINQFSLSIKTAGKAMVKDGGIGFIGHVSSLAGTLRRQIALVEAMGGKCDCFIKVRWGSLCTVVAWLKKSK
jgi:hypothetical protein